MSERNERQELSLEETVEIESLDIDRAKEKISKQNSENHELRKRLRDLEPKAKRFDELEEANQSEVEKYQKRITELEANAAKLERAALVNEIAAEKGLTPAQAKRLSGDDREALEADAAELAELFKGTQKADPITGKPTENLPRGGGDPETEVEETDPAKLAASVPRSGW